MDLRCCAISLGPANRDLEFSGKEGELRMEG